MALPTAIWSGTFTVWGIELRCHVLDTGQRIVEAEDMERFIHAMEDGDLDTRGDMAEFVRWQRGLS